MDELGGMFASSHVAVADGQRLFEGTPDWLSSCEAMWRGGNLFMAIAALRFGERRGASPAFSTNGAFSERQLLTAIAHRRQEAAFA